jgi:Uma2 family endonuclease
MPLFPGKVELIDGLLVLEGPLEEPVDILDQSALLPMLTSYHAGIKSDICAQIGMFLHGAPGRVYTSGFEVRLFPEAKGKAQEIVSPDITVVLDTAKIDMKSCNGAPDMTVEILSTNRKADLIVKREKYRKAGVREYWIVDPLDKTVTVNLLKDGEYITKVYDGATDHVPVSILPGLEVDFPEAFDYADVGQTPVDA